MEEWGNVWLPMTPVEAIEEIVGPSPRCDKCKDELEEFGVCDGVDMYLCDSCAQGIYRETLDKANLFAAHECKITCDLPTFDPNDAWACTREEYARGDRESNTENAHRTRCRHCYTNYDDLIRGLDRDSLYDRAKYDAIRDRIDELIDDALA